jgi:CPA1 family monovalent cation:H+ antiporter
MLLGATVIGMVARRLHVPYAVALVIAGLLIEETHLVSTPHLDPGLLLFAFLPPLLFDAAFRLDMRELRLVLRPVVWLAVPGVVITTMTVGLAVWSLLGVPLATGLLFGSVVAATDPVAVVAVLGSLRAPHRVTVVPEAESLINDGMAITLYTVLLGYALTGSASISGIGEVFAREVAGGILVGLAVAFAGARLTAAMDDHLLEMLLSTAVAYGSYLIADQLHASGALACVAAGFLHGSYGRSVGMSTQTSALLDDLWEYLGFMANAVVFLLVGFTVNLTLLRNEWEAVVAAVVAVVAARIAVVFVPAPISRRPAARTLNERVLLVWAGLRGALTIALVLALPAETPARQRLIAMAFGVVLFTMVAQGLSLSWLVRRLGFIRPTTAD